MSSVLSSVFAMPRVDVPAMEARDSRNPRYLGPLHEMVSTTPTELWNDSCAVSDLRYAIEHGAVGATSNPTIVYGVLQQELADWKDRIAELFATRPTWTEAQITWKLIEEMAVRGAELLRPIFDRTEGRKGFLSVQTSPEFHKSPDLLVKQALHFATLAPNIQVKIPATEAGIAAIEEVTAEGISINATVCFTVPQSIAVAEAVERGLKRRQSAGQSIAKIFSVCTIMVGRLDDWLKVIAEKEKLVPTPGTLDWAGVACMKRAYQIFCQAGYRTRLLSAAYRNHLHWSEFIGGDVVLTIPPAWQRRFNASSVAVVSRMDHPVPAPLMAELTEQFKDFRRAYEPDGLTPREFDTYGATARTLRTFLGSYYDLVGMIRDLRMPNPDL
jgi:transaldolase